MTRWRLRCDFISSSDRRLLCSESSMASSISRMIWSTDWECVSSSYRTARTSLASSIRPTLQSQRGLSGRRKMKPHTTKGRSVVNASGNLQLTDDSGANEMPKLIQSAIDVPIPANIPNAETWRPLLSALTSSDCHNETVATKPPVPSPRIIRATMNWANSKEDACRIAPIAWMALAIKIVLLRPRRSPRKMQDNAPKAPRRVNNATTVPDSQLMEAIIDF